MSRKNKLLFCIMGRTGAGKDSIIRPYLENDITFGKRLIKPIISYTTRPKREAETEGVEHYFISSSNADYLKEHNELLAYTQINGYEYFTLIDQIHDASIYCIDPDGFKYLKDHLPKDTIPIRIYIHVPDFIRKLRYIKRSKKPISKASAEFASRDASEYIQFSLCERYKQYDYSIFNPNGFLKVSQWRFQKIIEKCIKKWGWKYEP